MAPHSSTLAWNIPWMEEPGRLHSMGSRRVGHDLVTKPPPPTTTKKRLDLQAFKYRRAFITLFYCLHESNDGNGRRQWHPTPVLLPGISHGWRSLVGCSPWGFTELDTTEAT